MAANKRNGNETSRRGFLAAVGVGAAALAVPAGAVAARASGPAALIPGLREWYQREFLSLADELEADFRSGKVGDAEGWEAEGYIAFNRLGDIVRERFGLNVTETEDGADHGDSATAHMILAVSPSAEVMEAAGGYNHPAYCAKDSVVEDLLVLAAARGWIERPE